MLPLYDWHSYKKPRHHQNHFNLCVEMRWHILSTGIQNQPYNMQNKNVIISAYNNNEL